MPSTNNNLQDTGRWARFAEFCLDLESNQLYRGTERIPLPHRAGQVLSLLLHQHGSLVTRDQISDGIWGSRFVDFESSLNTAIRSIRRALNDDAANPIFVETVPRQGYRFLQTPVFSEQFADKSIITSLIHQPKRIAAVVFALAVFVVLFFLFIYDAPRKNNSNAMQAYLSSTGYEDFLRGRYAQSQGETDKAEAYLDAAIRADPDLAPAYVSLARLNVGKRRQGWDKLLTAQDLADKAVGIDPELVAAHILKAGLALYYWRDHATAHTHINKALAIAPDDPDALVTYAYLNIIESNTDVALDAIAKAHQLRPLSARLNADYGWILYKAGNWNDAERMCKTSAELNWQSQFALDCVIHINHSQGDHAEAAEFGLHLMALRGATESEIDRVRETLNAGEREAAYWNWTLDWLDASETDVSDPLSKRGITLTMLRQYDEAIAAFEDAFTKNGEPFLAFFAVDPRVANLHAHADFDMLAEHSRVPLPLN